MPAVRVSQHVVLCSVAVATAPCRACGDGRDPTPGDSGPRLFLFSSMAPGTGNGVQGGVQGSFTDGVVRGEALTFPYCDRPEVQSPFLSALLWYAGFWYRSEGKR